MRAHLSDVLAFNAAPARRKLRGAAAARYHPRAATAARGEEDHLMSDDQQWFYAIGGQQNGPVPAATLRQLLASGQVSPASLVWRAGMEQWAPATSVPELATHAAAQPESLQGGGYAPQGGGYVPQGGGYVPQGGGYVPAQQGAWPQPGSYPSYRSADYGGAGYTEYAGFWLRVVAAIIDIIASAFAGAILGGCIGGLIGGFMGVNHASPVEIREAVQPVARIAGTIAGWLYFALMESSATQATLGKMALGLRVTDLEGRRIGFGRATGRYFGKYISAIILGIGFIMAGFTERKQALHDIMAGTLVVKK